MLNLSRLLLLCALLLALLSAGPNRVLAGSPAAPGPGSGLRVVGQHTVALPDDQHRSLTFSPDGRSLAVLQPQALCVLALDAGTERFCVPLGPAGPRTVDRETMTWSPDGTRLASTENVAGTLRDSDVWVLDVAAGKPANLTDDGVNTSVDRIRRRRQATPAIGASGPPRLAVDLDPAWSADRQTTFFVRSDWTSGAPRTAIVTRIPAAGGQPEPVVTLAAGADVSFPGGLHPSADGTGIFDTLRRSGTDGRTMGIWRADLHGGTPRLLGGTGRVRKVGPSDAGLDSGYTGWRGR